MSNPSHVGFIVTLGMSGIVGVLAIWLIYCEIYVRLRDRKRRKVFAFLDRCESRHIQFFAYERPMLVAEIYKMGFFAANDLVCDWYKTKGML